MRNRSASKTLPGLLVLSIATLVLAAPAAALDADYWRGGWRTPLGDEPHIYEFVIDPARPPARPAGRGFALVGPIAPEGTKGNSSEGIDVWGAGTGSSVRPPPGRTPIRPVSPGR